MNLLTMEMLERIFHQYYLLYEASIGKPYSDYSEATAVHGYMGDVENYGEDESQSQIGLVIDGNLMLERFLHDLNKELIKANPDLSNKSP